MIADARLTDDALMLYELALDHLTLSDTIAAYATEGGPLIPLGEVSRLLLVDLAVSPTERRITGAVGAARRPVLIDMNSGLVRLNGVVTALDPQDLAVGMTDIYVRPALLERILPVRVSIEGAALRITLTAMEPLPIQAHLDRLGRLRDLTPELGSREDVLRVATPYSLFSAPAFDVSLAMAGGSRRDGPLTRYDVRAGADFVYSGFQGYLGSDDHGRPATARAMFERRDPSGMFGPLGITRASAGDVFTPTLALGARSVGGRGIALTTAPLSQASVFDRIDLRGELPIGYDIELYVNDVLRGAQQSPVEGRYEFLSVALLRGMNVVRLVSYGPQGQRSEETRVINVGDGQLAQGKLVADFGAVQQDRNLVSLKGRHRHDILTPHRGDLRLTTNLAYGLTSKLTVAGGLSSYTPLDGRERQLLTLGTRTSVLGFAPQIDGALDSRGGSGLSIGVSGRPFGIAAIVRHAEYRGGFVDETIPQGEDGRVLLRHSEATFDLSLRPFSASATPVAVSLRRDQFANGDVGLAGALRASTIFGRSLLSLGVDYEQLDSRRAKPVSRFSGNIAASTYVLSTWQLRANLDYTVEPSTRLRAMTLSADRSIGQDMSIHLGFGHSFEADRSSTAQASALFRLPFADLSIDGDYEFNRGAWRVGLSLAFSLARNPLRGGYSMRRIGAASGGNLALRSFIDLNGDGLFDAGEQPVVGLAIDGGFARDATDDTGTAFLSGLGYGAVARVRVNIDQVDLPTVATPPATIEYVPRAGRTTVVMYPVRPQGEVATRLVMRGADGKTVGLSAVSVQVISEAGKIEGKMTEYDGSVVFDRLSPGTYRLQLDPEQSKRLGMRLLAPITFVVPRGGGVIPDLRGEVTFAPREP